MQYFHSFRQTGWTLRSIPFWCLERDLKEGGKKIGKRRQRSDSAKSNQKYINKLTMKEISLRNKKTYCVFVGAGGCTLTRAWLILIISESRRICFHRSNNNFVSALHLWCSAKWKKESWISSACAAHNIRASASHDSDGHPKFLILSETYLWLQDCDEMPCLNLNSQCDRTAVLEPRPETSPRFPHDEETSNSA